MAKLLLVEDNLNLAKIIAEELAQAGFKVSQAADGLSALELNAREQPDLIILDWMLPKLDGIGVLQQIRQRSATPVLMLTARDEEADRIFGLNAGADDYLTKPFSTGELVARVQALLRRMELIKQILAGDRGQVAGAAAPVAPLVHGPLRLDSEARLAYLNGDPVDLSSAEFDLLHLFLRNPGRAFSRSYLLDTIWGEDYVAGDRSIDNMVLRLRKKLGVVGNEIETVWGIGYRLRAEQK
ncbi:MAG: response regulator transcription factor [Chloroflexi bacterium]|nr:response regulator transcription factor [Chloroflexota bacterium]